MSKVIIFIDEYSENLKNRLDSSPFPISDVLFLTLNERTFLDLRELSFRVCFLLEILTPEEIENTDKQCLEFIDSVFVADKDKWFTYKGIPMGYLIEYYLIPYFMRIFRAILCTDKAIKHFSFDKIIVAGGGEVPELVRFALQQKKIPFESYLGSKFYRWKYLLTRFSQGRKNLWVGQPLREFFVEPAQHLMVIIGESIASKLRLFLKRKAQVPSAGKYLIFSADQHTLRIYEHLQRQGDWRFLKCGLFYQFRKTVLKGVASFEGSFRLWMAFGICKALAHFLILWRKLEREKLFKKQFEFLGVKYWAMIKNLIRLNLFISFPRLFLCHIMAEKAFKSYPEALLLVSVDNIPYYKTVVHAARLHGIKSIVTNEGLYAGVNGHNTIESDYCAACGPMAFEWYREHWGPQATEKIFVTGTSRFDEYASTEKIDKEKKLDDLGLPHDKKLILILTEWSNDFSAASSDINDIQMINAVVGAVQKLGQAAACHIVIKPHPAADVELFRQACRSLEKNFPHMTLVEGHLKELLFIADICAGAYSTVILEAMFFEKPSIIFDGLAKKELVPFVSKGAALGASTVDEMTVALHTLLFNDEIRRDVLRNQKKFIEYATYRIDGKSTERVCDFIEKIMADNLSLRVL